MSRFRSNGHECGEGQADLCVINTCTVTRQADAKTVKLIRKLRKENPRARIIATGCMVETNREELESLGCIDEFVGNQEKSSIGQDQTCGSEFRYAPDRTRPFIKIQDGCDFNCSYCKVRLARGPGRSERYEHVLAFAKSLAEQNYREIVLTGVNIGDYHDQGYRLKDLLKNLIKIPGIEQVRLSSVEPTSIDKPLLSVLGHKKICKYFHVPLQSGSDKILKAMNRPYTVREYEDVVRELKTLDKEVIIGTDLITGFPNEEEEDFLQTLEFLKKNNIFYLHIFRYSKREHTPASLIKDNLNDKTRTDRAAVLDQYMHESKQKYFESLTGKRIRIMVENKVKQNRYISSVSPDYLKVLLPLELYRDKIGCLCDVRIERVMGQDIYGQ